MSGSEYEAGVIPKGALFAKQDGGKHAINISRGKAVDRLG